MREYDQLDTAIKNVVKQSGPIDVLINNAGLALGAPARFPDLKMKDIIQMVQTNIQGLLATVCTTMFLAYLDRLHEHCICSS